MSGIGKPSENALEFVDVAKDVLSPDVFRDSTRRYTGSLYPSDKEVSESGFADESIAAVYKPSILLDLVPVALSLAQTPEQVAKLQKIGILAEKQVQQKEAYDRYAEYQEALCGIVNSSKIFHDAIFEIENVAEDDASWIDSVKTGLEWAKESAERSVAKVFQAFSGVFDKVTAKIHDLMAFLSNWTSSMKKQLAEKIKEIGEYFMELMNKLLSTLFAWLGKIRKIAQDNSFSLDKTTVTVEPIAFSNITIFGFSVPVPVLKLPGIAMEFS